MCKISPASLMLPPLVSVEEALAAADAAALGVHQAFGDSGDLSGLKGRRGQQLPSGKLT